MDKGLSVLGGKTSQPVLEDIGYWMFDRRANGSGTAPRLSKIEYPTSVTPGS
jgi:hypothetical protein